jgi:hypothetical protein
MPDTITYAAAPHSSDVLRFGFFKLKAFAEGVLSAVRDLHAEDHERHGICF